jgi:4-amino-4-deoxy-L-arabinose transferase-like glycosyltransferase
VIGFFIFSWFKLDTYIFPAAPAVCLLAANAWQKAREDDDDRSWVRRSLVVIPIILALVGIGVWIFLFRLNLPIPGYAVILPVSLIVGGTGLAVQTYRAGWRPPAFGMMLIVPLICAYSTVVAAGFPVIDQTRPTPEIARWLTHTAPPSTEAVALYKLSRWQASLRFYSGRQVNTIETPEDLTVFLIQHPAGYVVLTSRERRHLEKLGTALTVVYERQAVVGTEGRGLRRQRWGTVVVATRR